MTHPEETILAMLCDMRAEMKDRFEQMDRQFADQDSQFDRLETCFDDLRAALYGRPGFGRDIGLNVEANHDDIENRLKAVAAFNEHIPLARRRVDVGAT